MAILPQNGWFSSQKRVFLHKSGYSSQKRVFLHKSGYPTKRVDFLPKAGIPPKGWISSQKRKFPPQKREFPPQKRVSPKAGIPPKRVYTGIPPKTRTQSPTGMYTRTQEPRHPIKPGGPLLGANQAWWTTFGCEITDFGVKLPDFGVETPYPYMHHPVVPILPLVHRWPVDPWPVSPCHTTAGTAGPLTTAGRNGSPGLIGFCGKCKDTPPLGPEIHDFYTFLRVQESKRTQGQVAKSPILV